MNGIMYIKEDSIGKTWSAKMIFYACLRAEKPFLPYLIPLFIISVISKLSFNLTPKLSTISDVLIFLPFVGPISGVMAMTVFKIVPNKWSITTKGISIRGREFKTIKWNKINNWSISPIKELEGCHVLRLNYGDARISESCIVVKQSYPIERILQRLTNCSTGPEKSAGQ